MKSGRHYPATIGTKFSFESGRVVEAGHRSTEMRFETPLFVRTQPQPINRFPIFFMSKRSLQCDILYLGP